MRKNKIKNALCAAAALAVCGSMFVACGDGEKLGETGAVRFESEYSEWGASTDGVELLAEGNVTASGGSCVAYFRAGSTLVFKVYSDVPEENVTLNVCGSSCVEMRDGGNIVGIRPIPGNVMERMLSLNGVPVENWSGKFMGSGTGDETGNKPQFDYYNWSVVSASIDICAGENTIIIKGDGSQLNWDYIELVTEKAAIYWQPEDIFEF